jgi:hypothetical protein
MAKSSITGSHNIPIFSFFRNLHTDFHMAALMYIPTNSVYEFFSPRILASYLCILYIMVGMYFVLRNLTMLWKKKKNLSCVPESILFAFPKIHSIISSFWSIINFFPSADSFPSVDKPV